MLSPQPKENYAFNFTVDLISSIKKLIKEFISKTKATNSYIISVIYLGLHFKPSVL